MSEDLVLVEGARPLPSSVRDFASIGFRHKRLIVGGLLAMLIVAGLCALTMPSYNAKMKLVLVRARLDPVLTTSPTASAPATGTIPISEEELNSEAELLVTDDLLREVVKTARLDAAVETSFWKPRLTDDERVARAVKSVGRKIGVEPVTRSNVIRVEYKSDDPRKAALVLRTLKDVYLAKRSSLQRLSGQSEFYAGQVELYRKNLAEAQSKLSQFANENGTVAPKEERDQLLQRMTEFTASREQAKAAIADTRNRIKTLSSQLATVPPRITTQLRRSDNQQLMEQMKATLLNLELKKLDLLSKYQPNYRPIQDLEVQIQKTRTALTLEQQAPAKEDITDQNPTSSWVDGELAKARSELAGLEARQAALTRTIETLRTSTQELDGKSRFREDLQREAKLQEDNYMMYSRKLEEARTADQMDKNRFVNVSFFDEPNVPALPDHNPLLFAFAGAFVVGLITLGAVAVAEWRDGSFRTPTEVATVLNLPVLAAIPSSPLLLPESEARTGSRIRNT